MQTQCISEQLGFEGFGGRRVEAAFDGGAVSSDAGALLLRETDRAIDRIAVCFRDGRDPSRVVHSLRTLIGQRIIGLALGYEDVNDHDELRFDPVLALFADRLEPRRPDCAALGGKSTLNRLEHALRTTATARSPSTGAPSKASLSTSSSTRMPNRRRRSSLTWTPPTIRCTAIRKAASSTVTMAATATCRFTSSAVATCSRRSSGAPASTPRPASSRKSGGSLHGSARVGRGSGSCFALTAVSPARR